MIFDRYPVMNLPRQTAPLPAPPRPRPALGQAVSAEAQAAGQVFAAAQKNLANVNATYANLVQLLGEDRANQAIQEAQASVQAAQEAYQSLAGGAR